MSELQRGHRADYPGAYYAEESLQEINTFEETSTNNAFNSVDNQWMALCSKFQEWSTSFMTDPQKTNELIQEFQRLNEELVNIQHEASKKHSYEVHSNLDRPGRLFQKSVDTAEPSKTETLPQQGQQGATGICPLNSDMGHTDPLHSNTKQPRPSPVHHQQPRPTIPHRKPSEH
jgi:hypothetical protein